MEGKGKCLSVPHNLHSNCAVRRVGAMQHLPGTDVISDDDRRPLIGRDDIAVLKAGLGRIRILCHARDDRRIISEDRDNNNRSDKGEQEIKERSREQDRYSLSDRHALKGSLLRLSRLVPVFLILDIVPGALHPAGSAEHKNLQGIACSPLYRGKKSRTEAQ